MKNLCILTSVLFVANLSAKEIGTSNHWAHTSSMWSVLSNANDPIGYWNYSAPNAPYEYSKGVMVISKVEGAYNVVVHVNGGSIIGEDVKVNGNEIKFKVYIEGDTVSVTLTVDNDTISGNSVSSQGSLAIEGKRGEMPE